MKVFATKSNYDKARDGYSIRQCLHVGVMGCTIKEDPDKLWRCAECFQPAYHPNENAEGPTVDQWPPPYHSIDYTQAVRL